jgi:ribosomal protein S18 acetylase RimI-like enzyme
LPDRKFEKMNMCDSLAKVLFSNMRMSNLTPPIIRRYEPEDWSQLWPLLHATFAAGDTYAFAPESTEAEIRKAWIDVPLATYVVAANDSSILGTYKLQENQPGLGSHVSNCGYVVARNARGQGIASTMCEHSQAEAVRLGFKAMQFNLVVSTNDVAVRLWEKHGFAIVGTLPGAFQHMTHGYVDAYVMFKVLV